MSLDRRRLLHVAGAVAAIAPLGVAAQPTAELRILLDSASPTAAGIARALDLRFDRVTAVTDIRQLRATPAPKFYVAIGADALSAVAGEQLNAPALALLVSRQAYERIVAGRTDAITGIYADPSPANQMRLIRAVFRRRVTVGSLVH